MAIRRCADPMVIHVIEQGADVRQADALGNTPLHIAAKKDILAIMKSLVQHGANVLAKDADGRIAKDCVPPKATGTKKYLDRAADRQNAENVLAMMSMHGKPDKASTKFYTQAPGMAHKVAQYLGGRGRRTKKRR